MKRTTKTLAAALLTAASCGLSASVSHAVTYVEPGDAGQTLATAANTGLTVGGSGAATNTITGTIGTSADADLYLFTLATGSVVISAAGGASSVAGNGNIDTSLFLFDASGNPVSANDDQSTINYQGQLTLTGLAPGTYYVGISLSGNEPVNSANQLLFTTDQPTTAVRGGASGINPTTESTFNGATYVPETGPYSITFTVPEPSTWATIALGGAFLGVFLRRYRQAAQA